MQAKRFSFVEECAVREQRTTLLLENFRIAKIAKKERQRKDGVMKLKAVLDSFIKKRAFIQWCNNKEETTMYRAFRWCCWAACIPFRILYYAMCMAAMIVPLWFLSVLIVNLVGSVACVAGIVNVVDGCEKMEEGLFRIKENVLTTMETTMKATDLWQGKYDWYKEFFNLVVSKWNYWIPSLKIDLFSFVLVATPRAASQALFTWTTIGVGALGSILFVGAAIFAVPGLQEVIYLAIPANSMAWFCEKVYDLQPWFPK
jgi:hypothetical protein